MPLILDTVEHLESVPSTNDYIRRWIGEGRPRVVMADEQTEGRGQYGRSWHSPRGVGLYVSYLIFPEWETGRSQYLLMIGALAVVMAIRRAGGEGFPIHLKAPNDVLIGKRKVCGILTELGTTGKRIEWAVIGIGVNLGHLKFPRELAEVATSLQLEGIELPRRSQFCGSLTACVIQLNDRLERGEWEAVKSEYQALLRAQDRTA